MKVKLTKLFHPNISILTTENGGRGTHFAKFLISPFQWGLTHSAMDSVHAIVLRHDLHSGGRSIEGAGILRVIVHGFVQTH